MTEPCPFCSIPPADVIAEDDHVIVLRDRYPVSPGHTLIVTKRHIPSFFETTEAERQAILQSVHMTQQALEHSHQPAGYNIGINVGAAAGQTVMHLHVHVIPRYQGDTDDPRGGIRHCIPGKGYYPSSAS